MNAQGGGCCIAKQYGGGYGMSKVDRIMLKFRPIAPKPVAAGGSTADNSSDGYVKCRRSKRKYVRVKKNKNDNNIKRQKKKVKASSFSTPVVTLPLLPETPDRKDNEPVTGFCSDLLSPVQTTKIENNNNNNDDDSPNNNEKKKLAPAPVWLRFDGPDQVKTNVLPPALGRLPRVVSYVTVECVTDTWVDWEALGCTDEEIIMNLEKDTCPGFISDGQDRVVWTNTAYRHMAGEDDIAVVLVRKDKWTRLAVTNHPAFTCKVRVARSDRQTQILTLPCDVWRMKCGACAWRLDVNAALSLGR